MLSENMLIGWTLIIVDPLDMVETICKNVTHIIRILIETTLASNLLNGKWGIYDVQDCKDAATTLSSDPLTPVDGKRVAIRGGSAGAYTTLASVTFAPEAILTYYKTACGAYGCVADVETLTKVTEKFEMNYIDTLFGCPPGPAWDSRNPIKHVANLDVPLLVRDTLRFVIMCGLIDVTLPW